MIRLATQHDLQAIYALAGKLATSFVVTEYGFANSFKKVIELPHMNLVVAEVDSAIIGYVLGSYHPCFYASGNVAWIEEIFVEPEHRGSGLGRDLMTNFEEWAEDQNCRLVALATRRAADFYQAINYDETAVCFRKQLNQ